MTWTRDARESRPEIQQAADGEDVLEYRLPENPTALYTYDGLVTWEGGQMRLEAKQWQDYCQSWTSGKLDRQIEAVDVFIVEKDPLTDWRATPAMRLFDDNAEKHLVSLSLQMPVVRTESVYGTIAAIRHIEATQGGTKIRANRVKAPSESPRFAMLNALPGVNPHRRLPDGRLLGEAIWNAPGRPEAVLAALGVAGWSQLPGLGPGTVAKATKAILGPT